MSKEQFASLNAAQREVGEREYSNPRNLVAGVLNRCFLFLRPALVTVSHDVVARAPLPPNCHQEARHGPGPAQEAVQSHMLHTHEPL